jgi:hypothetical protein
MRKPISYVLILLSFLFFSYRYSFYQDQKQSSPASECNITNDAFSAGEEIVYKIWYNWGFIWLESGETSFSVYADDYKGVPCYRFVSIGRTYPKYDWFYSVRDTFTAWVDTTNLRPYHFIRNCTEGGSYIYEDSYFNYDKKKAYVVTRKKKKMPRLDSVTVNSCSYDVLSLIYYTRNIDFSKYKVKDTVPLNMFLESKTYPTYLRYLGKDVFDAGGLGKFNCIKFRAKLIAGTLFSGGEAMTVWGTNDKNHVPLFVEAPILVGSVKAKIIRWKGLKNKIEAKAQ